MIYINPEVLIGLVKGNPCIWDRSWYNHRDHARRRVAWHDICKALKPDYDDLSKTESENFVKAVMKKWANLRDAWRKCEERNKTKPYLFHEELKFLQKNFQDKKSGSADDVSDDASDSLGSDRPAKRRNTSNLGNRSLNLITAAEDSHVSFIKGLLPSLNKLGEDETLEFQMGVIKLLRDIKKEKKVDNDSVQYLNAASQNFEIPVIKEEIE